MRILTLLGARPQFIKASMLSRAFLKVGIKEDIVHSGQHYDKRISQIFFEELGLPIPSKNLRVGSASHAVQTARIMTRLEAFIKQAKPFDLVLVFGDTNTTLAGALVAAKRGIPVIHVEAGLRSFNRAMPEEVNRIVTDRVSQMLCCPTQTAMHNLHQEGINKGVFLSGDVMLDATLHFSELANYRLDDRYLESLNENEYFLTTIHRASNTNNLEILADILDGLNSLNHPILFPIHPRTRESIKGLSLSENIKIIEPASYLEMLSMIRQAKAVITDSGGVQKEAYWLKVPCITLRNETEWTETLSGRWNQLVGRDADLLRTAVSDLANPRGVYAPFGRAIDGSFASTFIANKIKMTELV